MPVSGTNTLWQDGIIDVGTLKIGAVAVSATPAELNYLDISSLGTGALEKAIVLDSGEDYIWPSGGKLTYGGTQITATGAEINYNDITTLGTAEASKTLTVDANKRLIWTTTSDQTVNPISFTSTMTGAGTTGGRALFQMNAEAALGGWSNALKAIVVYGASASTSGLGSAFVAELQLSAGTTTGTYAPLESEIVVGSGGSLGTATSFFYMNVDDDSNTFRDGGLFFQMGAGVSANGGGMFDTSAITDINSTHSLKVKIAGVLYYIPLHTAQNFGG